MSADQTRVVVTGLGAISPVGADVATTWKSLLAGHSGVAQLTDSWAGELPARIAARAAADPAARLDRIRVARPDYVLILPWNLADEIAGQAAYIRDWGGSFVTPIPEVRVF